jgi:hypothetical protein
MHLQFIKIASNLKIASLLVTNPTSLFNVFKEMGLALNIERN